MNYLKKYLKTISDRGNIKLSESILKTSDDIGAKYIRSFPYTGHEIGLLFGNVQSGKTGQMFGIICKAADLGFPVFVLLTTDNIVLQQQTLERVKEDLDGFCICGENDGGLFLANNLLRPVIIVLKKNVRILKLWSNILNSTGFMRGNPLFIIDDEADAASLNNLINRDKKSSVNRYLESIKDGASSSLYLQVTGTPQAILLQTLASGWRPYFTYYFEPGNEYLGGNYFFPPNRKSDAVLYLEDINNPTRAVIIRHLVVSGQIIKTGGKVSNCLFHPSVRQNIHNRYAEEVNKELKWCLKFIDTDFKEELKKEYGFITPQKTKKVPFEELYETVVNLLQKDQVKVLIMNGKSEVSSSDYAEGVNIIIGGNTLGRGVTFPSLHTIYYTRTSKKPQADTMWQHSRMFGYDRDPGLMNIFIDECLYKLFADINATNNSIISQIENGSERINIYYPKGISPTRISVLDKDKVNLITGGRNYYPFNPDNDTIEKLDQLLAPFDHNESFYQVNIRLMLEIFKHIKSDKDFKISAFNGALLAILANNPTAQGILIVRRNRDIAKGTGAMLSPNDWFLGASQSDKTVLTMYKVTGNKGWFGKQLWIPNIKLPESMVYYDVEEELV